MKRTTTLITLRHTVGGMLLASAVLLTALLAGCSKDDATQGSAAQDGVIRINASIDNRPQSRAAVDNLSALADVQFLRQDVAGAVAPTTYAGSTPLGGSREAGGRIIFATSPTYNTNNRNAWFVAYWPKQAPVSNVVTWMVDGKTDILLTDAYNAGTYTAPLTGDGGAAGDPMRFRHQLAQLEVVCVPDPDVPLALVQQTWGKITRIEIVQSNSAVKFYYSSPNSVGYATPTAIALVEADYATDFPAAGIELTPTPNPAITAAGMFAPDIATASTAPVKLMIYTEQFIEGVPIDVQLTDGGGSNTFFEKGKKHTVTLTFKPKPKYIRVLSTQITDWDAGYAASGDVELAAPTTLEYGTGSHAVTDGDFDGTPQTFAGSTGKSYNGYLNNNIANNGGYQITVGNCIAEQPYRKLEIAPRDESTTMTWANAWTACQNKAYLGGGWRLPRQSELMLIWLNKSTLDASDGFIALDAETYWAATEYDGSQAWSTHLGTGATVQNTKTGNNFRVRCVRESV